MMLFIILSLLSARGRPHGRLVPLRSRWASSISARSHVRGAGAESPRKSLAVKHNSHLELNGCDRMESGNNTGQSTRIRTGYIYKFSLWFLRDVLLRTVMHLSNTINYSTGWCKRKALSRPCVARQHGLPMHSQPGSQSQKVLAMSFALPCTYF